MKTLITGGCILAAICFAIGVADAADLKSGFMGMQLSLIHISEPTRLKTRSRMPSSA